MELIGKFCTMDYHAYDEDIARLTKNEIIGFGEPDTANFALGIDKTDGGVWIISVYRKHSFSEVVDALCGSLLLVANNGLDSETSKFCSEVESIFKNDFKAVLSYRTTTTILDVLSKIKK